MTIPPLPHSASLAYVEALYLDYLHDPNSVDDIWQQYFSQLDTPSGGNGRIALQPSFTPFSLFSPPAASSASAPHPTADDADISQTELQYNIGMLIRNYRVRGHIKAQLDPLGFLERETPTEMTLEYYGLGEADMDRVILSGTQAGHTVREAFNHLNNTYCGSIGVQFMHIDDYQSRKWLQERMESTENKLTLDHDTQVRILAKLTDAVVFEEFIAKKYVGMKSFSLQGGETLIPLLDQAIERAGNQGVREVVLGMAHRGRLNVLANTCGKPARQIFREFDDADGEQYIGRGDVKYHLGYSQDIQTSSGHTIHMSLCFNPSHLEFVNPVVVGRVRGKQDRRGDTARRKGLAIQIHGDAAFIGEGVVQETLNMSDLAAYTVGGTLHVILNNQVGFTTSPEQSRSSTYCTDVAKMLQSPIFHVNGEDPEAVAQVVALAMDFRQEFQRDVVIDMYCYRRFGHNESDEPTFTQPLMYKAIKKHKNVRDAYLERLTQIGKITKEQGDTLAQARQANLDKELDIARQGNYKITYSTLQGVWQGYKGGPDSEVPEVFTGADKAELQALLHKLTEVPEGFTPNSKILRLLSQRREMATEERRLDWATTEALAFASLVVQGHRLRMTGQDVERGTFSHRHAVLRDVNTEARYCALQHLSEDQGPVEIINSSLSENGVLGFEYGYSLDWPDGLTLWEAQFGDFANTAQVIIDQFISSGEDKWRRLSGLVLLLPHGFEGAGPEHSSARLERYLALAAEDNMTVLNITHPSGYFHALRRQVLRPWRKPMIVMSPKSLLRHPDASSSLDSLATGHYRKVIVSSKDPKTVKRLIFCSGKVYYDLRRKRTELGKEDEVAIVRLEQLYPVPHQELESALAPYKNTETAIWVQEEPWNMGAWFFLRARLGSEIAGHKLIPVTRPESASPATGSGSSHRLEQNDLMEQAFTI